MAKKKSVHTISNKRARFDYEIIDIFMAGLALTGAEVRSLRENHGSLNGAYVQVKNNEVWLINGLVTPLQTNIANLDKNTQTRDRKLLLKSNEIKQLIEAKSAGNTIIPIKLLTSGRFIKIEIATAKGKRKHDKREVIKKRDQDREARRLIKTG